jgi:uncharacterized protein (UPF0276 family)
MEPLPEMTDEMAILQDVSYVVVNLANHQCHYLNKLSSMPVEDIEFLIGGNEAGGPRSGESHIGTHIETN